MKPKRKLQIEMLRKLNNAIKEKCKVDCCVNDRISWIKCNIPECPLWKYRLGDNLKLISKKTKEKQQNIPQNTIQDGGCEE